MSLHASIGEARRILAMFGFDEERSNERSALVLLALANLRPGESWTLATNPMYGTRAIMNHIRDVWGKDYAPNTRETIRRFTLHQFADVGFVEQNSDKPDRPVNSPLWNYRLSDPALEVIQAWGRPVADDLLETYLDVLPSQIEVQQAQRGLLRIPITLPDGSEVTLYPGGQNVLIKAMVEEFCPRFTPGGQVLYLGDADAKLATFDRATLLSLGVTVNTHGKMPDLVVYLPDRNWLVVLEAASSHGPVDHTRLVELKRVFAGATPGLVFVSCFPSRAAMRKYLAAIAWETDAWCADTPDHLVHFNGTRFLGPY